jgi:hypothetical protein
VLFARRELCSSLVWPLFRLAARGVQAEGLSGQARSTHSFARVGVAGQVQLTGVRWATLHPQWADEGLVFRRGPGGRLRHCSAAGMLQG